MDALKVGVRRDADGVTVFTATPQSTPEDLIKAFAAVNREGPTRLMLWDIREANLCRRISNDEVAWMMRQLTTFSEVSLAGRSAFVAANDLDYGMMRALGTHAEPGGCRALLRVFRDVGAARAWLLGLIAGEDKAPS